MSRFNARILSIFAFCLWLSTAERDFNFNDQLQITLIEPQEEPKKHLISYKSPYQKEISKCPSTESKMMLSLILKDTDWKDIIEKKKNRAVNKLSKFFAVPKEYVQLESVSAYDLFDMDKNSVRRGANQCKMDRRLGKLEFMIGCGDSLFAMGEPISNQIRTQMVDGSIDDISGLNFGMWMIWRRKVSNRVQRHRRQTEGSGEDDYDYNYDDDEETVTDLPAVTTHAHRHHHGGDSKEEDVKSDSTTTVAPIVEVKENSNTKEFELESSSTSEEPSTTIVNTTPVSPMVSSTTSMSTSTTTTTTTPKPTTTTTIPTTEYIEPEPMNTPPMIKTRLPKQPVTAGKPFSLTVPLETFYDNEEGTNLRLQLFDKNNHDLKPSSWIQFNTDTREIYGLPLEDAVSRWQYLLAATDSGNETAVETLDISVQQHKGHRSVNHEISISVKLNEKFVRNIDWQIRLIRGIAETLNDNSLSNVVVREIRQNQQDPQLATFIYTNESLPKDRCPEEKLEELVKRLDPKKLTDSLLPELSVKSVTAQLIGPCQKITVPKSRPTPHATKNFPPVPRNQVDRVNATAGHLLVFKVPADTFYDPEDTTDLKLALLTSDQKEINPRHWLQFDSKNQEFYGIPKSTDHGSEEYLLVATDNGGLTASDALVVVVNHAQKRDFSVLFKVFLDIPHENFSPLMQRKFVERVAQLFGDNSPQFIQIRTINTDHDSDGMIVHFYNTTLFKAHNRCPEEEIEAARNVFFHQDSILRDRVKKVIGNEFRVTSVQIVPMGSCHSLTDTIHREYVPSKPDDNHTNKSSTTDRDDYLFTFILPAVIIFVMVLLATIIACVLHRRRMTGKMELGDEEERKSFRSKGIPVIFQDELDEKPEIGNKSPVILKHEKPPLLPPSYNSTNLDEDNDVDEYVPPPAVVMGGREARGKSPVTPSYRKPPPYVSP